MFMGRVALADPEQRLGASHTSQAGARLDKGHRHILLVPASKFTSNRCFQNLKDQINHTYTISYHNLTMVYGPQKPLYAPFSPLKVGSKVPNRRVARVSALGILVMVWGTDTLYCIWVLGHFGFKAIP